MAKNVLRGNLPVCTPARKQSRFLNQDGKLRRTSRACSRYLHRISSCHVPSTHGKPQTLCNEFVWYVRELGMLRFAARQTEAVSHTLTGLKRWTISDFPTKRPK